MTVFTVLQKKEFHQNLLHSSLMDSFYQCYLITVIGKTNFNKYSVLELEYLPLELLHNISSLNLEMEYQNGKWLISQQEIKKGGP